MKKDLSTKINCFLLGEDYEEVKYYQPSSKKKLKSLATTLMIPVLTYFFSMYFISKILFGCDELKALLCAVAAAFFIYIIEKSIVLVVPKKGRFYKWGIIGLRILLGVMISLVASIFIDQLIYKNEIDEESTIILKQNIAEKYDLEMLKKNMDSKYSVWQSSQKIANEEADGNSGSHRPGLGEIAKQKIKTSEANQVEYNNSKKNYDNAIKLQNAELNNIKEIVNTSFLTRIKALENVLSKDNTLKYYRWGFTILIMLIESLVVIIKFTSSQSIDEFIQERKEELLIQKYSGIKGNNDRIFNVKESNNNIKRVQARLNNYSFN